MMEVSASIVIELSVAEVADYAGNPHNAPVWHRNIQTVEWETERPLRVGSRMTFVARFLGRTLRTTHEVVELEPERHLTMRTTDGPFPLETRYSWQREGESATRMTLRNRGGPQGFSRFAAPVVAAAMRRVNHKDLRRLKRLLESPVPGLA